jgi:sugar/nucleoside kinase (ribokinase family)
MATASPPRPAVIVVGDVNVDLGLTVARFPREGQDAQAQGKLLGSGGGGLNMAVAFAALGASVKLVARVGNDPAAQVALSTARQRGVDLSQVASDKAASTGTCVVITSASGERTLFSHRGANGNVDSSQLLNLELASCKLLAMSGYGLLSEPASSACRWLIEQAHTRGLPVALDLGLAVVERCRSTLLSLLPSIGLLLLNGPELQALTEREHLDRGLDWLLAQGASTVALKRGERGCTMTSAVERLDCPPVSVVAIDSTACGDAFAAACALGWARGLGLEACGQLGNIMGARTATRHGAAEAIPSSNEIAPLIHREVACALGIEPGS